MPAPANQPLRVAECTGCGQLFAVYETAGEVACPACATANSVESLEVAELQVANSVPMEVKAPEPTPAPEPAPEPITPVQFSIEPTVSEPEPAAADPVAAEPKKERPPTVAEWLVRSESETPAAEASEPNPEPATDLASKPSLSQSLGWNPGGFRLDNAEPAPTADPTPVAEAPVQEPPSEVPQPVAADSEFKFDFGGTPLHQQPSAGPYQDEELADEELAEEPAESMGLDLEAGDEAPGSSIYDWVQSEEPARRGWFGPLTAAAGLLAVAAPLAYFGWDSFGESIVAASDNRAERASLADVMSDEEPPIPWEGADEPDSLPMETATAEPRLVDTATEPASFEVADDEAEGFDSMPGQDTPPPADNLAQANTAPADPFNAPLPAATEPSAYNPPAGDRYAASQASADVPIDTFDETVRLPSEQSAEPLRPVPRNPAPRRQVGLANAPTYSVGDLNAAIGTAIPAGQGFALGTMSDPEQVKSMGQHYAQLCYLAQTLTLFDPNSTDPSRMTAELEAADVFKRLFIEAQPREESRQIAGPWIAWTGRPHGGVFFVGKPTGMDMPGEVVQYNFQLGETTVPVLMAEKLDTNRFMTAGAKEIGVIGVVVENPRQWIVGYEGDAERVVWARKTLPLREPKQL